jgi:hypothetical protein
MAKTRSPRRRVTRPQRPPWQLFLLLVPLVLAIVILGNLSYAWLLAAGSAIFVGFFGWLAWSRRQSKTTTPARPSQKRR